MFKRVATVAELLALEPPPPGRVSYLAVTVDKADAGRVMQALRACPLPLRHLKRVKPVPAAGAGSGGSGAAEEPPPTKKQRHAPGALQILVCPEADTASLPPATLAVLDGAGVQGVVDVPDAPPRNPEERATLSADVWPVTMAMAAVVVPKPLLLRGEEDGVGAQVLDFVVRLARDALAAGWPPVACAIVDPVAGIVLCAAHSHTQRAVAGPRVDAPAPMAAGFPVSDIAAADAGSFVQAWPPPNPLKSAIMVALELLAGLQRAAPPRPNPTDLPYLCTGYDLYTTLEPGPMDAMGLVHSRVRRVFYGAPNPHRGVCGSKLRLHDTALTHRYEVYAAQPGAVLDACRGLLPTVTAPWM